jgi:hypothetical protein
MVAGASRRNVVIQGRFAEMLAVAWSWFFRLFYHADPAIALDEC